MASLTAVASASEIPPDFSARIYDFFSGFKRKCSFSSFEFKRKNLETIFLTILVT